jgi:hypothetical protein
LIKKKIMPQITQAFQKMSEMERFLSGPSRNQFLLGQIQGLKGILGMSLERETPRNN